MPNHVENRIEFSGDALQIKAMLESIKNDEYGIGTINFNKIILMPESLNIEAGSRTDRGLKAYRDFIEVYTFGRSAEEAQKALESIPVESENAFLRQRTDVRRDEWKLGKTAWNNVRLHGAPTWYDWCIQNWGTKWNAYGYEPDTDYSGSDALAFQIAWAGPHPILQRLSEMFPNIAFRHLWADEDIGANCGERCYFGDEMTDEYIPEGIRAADFAFKVWDYDPLELGMAKNSTGTDYINIENESYQLIEMFGKPALFSNDRIVMKTGVHPMRVHPKLFFKWGIEFDDEHPYAVPDQGNREVKYADKKEIQNGILEKYPPEWKEETPVPSDADGDGQAQQDSPKNEPQRTPPKDKNRGGKPIRTLPPKKETAPDMTEAEIIKDLTETEVQSNEPS